MNGVRASSSMAGIFRAERISRGAEAGRRISHRELEIKDLFQIRNFRLKINPYRIER